MIDFQQTLTMLKQKNGDEINEFGEGFFMPPATSSVLEELTMLSAKYLQQPLAEEYRQCLVLSDGFSINGLNLYAATEKLEPYFLPGIIQVNLALWQDEVHQQFIYYGDESLYRLAFDIKNQKYACVDQVSHKAIQQFDSFADLLTSMILEAEVLTSLPTS